MHGQAEGQDARAGCASPQQRGAAALAGTRSAHQVRRVLLVQLPHIVHREHRLAAVRRRQNAAGAQRPPLTVRRERQRGERCRFCQPAAAIGWGRAHALVLRKARSPCGRRSLRARRLQRDLGQAGGAGRGQGDGAAIVALPRGRPPRHTRARRHGEGSWHGPCDDVPLAGVGGITLRRCVCDCNVGCRRDGRVAVGHRRTSSKGHAAAGPGGAEARRDDWATPVPRACLTRPFRVRVRLRLPGGLVRRGLSWCVGACRSVVPRLGARHGWRLPLPGHWRCWKLGDGI